MGKVLLNGVSYNIKGTVTEKAVNPFYARVSQGPKDFGSYAACETVEYSDLRGGMGIGREASRSDRFWYGNTETEKNGYALSTYAGVAASLGDIPSDDTFFCDFEGKTCLFGNSVSRYDTGTDFDVADPSPLATPSDRLTIRDSTDNYLVVCNGADARYTATGYDASPISLYAGELAWTDASGGDVNCLADATNKVIGAASAKMACADTLGVESMAYYGMVATDITTKTHIVMWIHSDVAIAAADLEFVIDEQAALAMGATHEHINIPALIANKWTRVVLTIATPADLNAVLSIGVRQLVDKGAFNLRIDQIQAVNLAGWAVLTTSDIKYMCGFDKRLCAVDATGSTLYSSAQNNIDDSAGGAMTNSFAMTGTWNVAYDLFYGLMPQTGVEAIFMVTDVGLVAIDYASKTAELMDVKYPPPPIGVYPKGMYYNGEIFVTTQRGIKKISPSGIVTEWGPDQDDGVSSTYYGDIKDIIATANHVLLLIGGKIFKKHSTIGGWHFVGQASAAQSIHCSPIGTPVKIYYHSNTAKAYYIPFMDTRQEFSSTGSYSFTTSALALPIFSAVETIPKIALSCKAITENCSATCYITVEYKINSAAVWTTLGNFISSPYPTLLPFASGAGAAFYNIQFLVTLTPDPAALTTSPVLKSLLFEYVINPSYIGNWTFNLDMTGVNGRTIYNSLVSARDATTLVPFAPTGNSVDGTYYVKVNQIPSQFDAYFPAPNRQMTVTVSEVT